MTCCGSRNITIAVSLLGLLAATLMAAEGLDPLGRPKEFVQGKHRMYGVWYEEGLWRLRTTSGKGVKIEFTGTVEIDAGSITPDYSALEKTGNRVDDDAVRLSKGGKKLDFRFITLGATDGVDFKVGKNAKSVKFTLRTAGDDDPRFIFIGGKSAHPTGGTFTIPAHPEPAPEAVPK